MKENKILNISEFVNAAKAILRGKHIALITYMRKEERFQMNEFIFQNKILERGKIKTKLSKNKETLEIKVDINEMKTEKLFILDKKNWLISSQGKITNVKNEKDGITTDATYIKTTIVKCYKQLYINKFDHLRWNGQLP